MSEVETASEKKPTDSVIVYKTPKGSQVMAELLSVFSTNDSDECDENMTAQGVCKDRLDA